jgi:hypothetical protein
MALDLRRPDSFDVARPREIEVTLGDKILIRANNKRLGLTNGQVLTVSSIAPDGTRLLELRPFPSASVRFKLAPNLCPKEQSKAVQGSLNEGNIAKTKTFPIGIRKIVVNQPIADKK